MHAASLQQNFTEAHEILNKIETQLETVEPIVSVRYFLERGRSYNSAGEKNQARDLFLKAWDLGKEQKLDNLAIDAAHMIAITESGKEALAWNERALDFAEHSKNPLAQKWKGSLYNNIGWTYHDMKEYNKALSLFERALSFREEQKNPENIRIAKWCIGRCLRSLGNIDDALEKQHELLNEFESLEQNDGYVFEELAECYYTLGDKQKAAPFFSSAYEELSKDTWLMQNQKERVDRLQKLSSI